MLFTTAGDYKLCAIKSSRSIVHPSLLSVLGLLYAATIDAWPFQGPGQVSCHMPSIAMLPFVAIIVDKTPSPKQLVGLEFLFARSGPELIASRRSEHSHLSIVRLAQLWTCVCLDEIRRSRRPLTMCMPIICPASGFTDGMKMKSFVSWWNDQMHIQIVLLFMLPEHISAAFLVVGE